MTELQGRNLITDKTDLINGCYIIPEIKSTMLYPQST